MRIATSVHITRVPGVRTSVLDRTLHRATCVCGQLVAVDVAFTYVDVERGHWVQVERVHRTPDWPTLEAATMDALARGLDMTSPIISGLAESARRRLVFGVDELREKLVVWDAGIDDGLIECIKLRAWIDEPSLMRGRLVTDRVTDDGGLELLRTDENPARRFAVPASWVDRALDEQASLRARYPELFGGGFVNTLRLIAIVALALAGCSQPHARETPALRPKDASAPVVVDAAVAASPPDVPASVDAARHRVLWQVMRDRGRTAANLVVAALVVETHAGDADTSILLDRGTDDSVQVGWKARLLDEGGYPVSDIFEITGADKRTCKARVKATPDQIEMSKRVVLWDPSRQSEP